MKQLVICVIAATLFSSCNQMSGSGNLVKEKRQTGDFKGISAGGSFEVEVKNGPTSVEVEADDNIINLVETEVRNGILRINTKDGNSFNDATFRVFVSTPQLETVKSSGAADIKLLDVVKGDEKLDFDVSGAAHISGTVDAPEVYAEVSGAGKIELSGRTREYVGKVSGSGELKSGDLRSETADIHVSGAGNAHVHASVLLKGEASGAGNIIYNGGARVEQRTSGAGSVKKQD